MVLDRRASYEACELKRVTIERQQMSKSRASYEACELKQLDKEPVQIAYAVGPRMRPVN